MGTALILEILVNVFPGQHKEMKSFYFFPKKMFNKGKDCGFLNAFQIHVSKPVASYNNFASFDIF